MRPGLRPLLLAVAASLAGSAFGFAVDADVSAHPIIAAGTGAAHAAPRQWALKGAGEHLVLYTEHAEEVLRIPAKLAATYGGKDANWTMTPWALDDTGAFSATATSDDAVVTFRAGAESSSPLVRLSVDIEYKRQLLVDAEVWTLQPRTGAGTVLDRAYRAQALTESEVFVDRWTPRVMQWATSRGPAFGLIGDDNVQAMRASTRALHFELDHWANHTHTVYPQCWERYAPDRPLVHRSRRARAPGEVAHYEVTLVAGDARPPVLQRWPDAYQAAMVIVDHADRTTSTTLRAGMYGDSLAKTPEGGLVGNGLVLTKTVFVSPRQLLDPAFASLADELSAQGVEIAPHSITPQRDSPDDVSRGLGVFERYRPKTWVDHQPDTNCEGMNNVGGTPGAGDAYVAALHAGGIRYIWEAPDWKGRRGINLFRPNKSSTRVGFFYPAPSLGDDAARPWLFRSAWMFLDRERVLGKMSPRKLNLLEADHGLHIAHTYLGSRELTGQYAGRSILMKTKHGVYKTRPEFERLWAELGARHARGSLWVTTMSELGDWMSSWAGTRLRPVSSGAVQLIADAGAPPAHRFYIAAAAGSQVGGAERASVRPGETVPVAPYVYEPDIGVTLTRVTPEIVASRERPAYVPSKRSRRLLRLAKKLGAPGAPVENPCTRYVGETCAASALTPVFTAFDSLARLPGAPPPDRVGVVVFGNSLIASDHVTDVVRARLQKRFGNGGHGIVYVDKLLYFGRRAWTGKASSGWYTEYLTQYQRETRKVPDYPIGVMGGHHISFKKGARTEWKVGQSREAELLWYDHPRAPAMELRIDGDVVQRIESQGEASTRLLRVDLPAGSERLELVAEGPRAVVYGATLERPTPGVVLDTVGIVAASSHAFLLADENVFQEQLRARDPKLVVLQLGGNETRRIDRKVFSRKQVRRDFVRFVDRIRTAVPDAACLVVGPIEAVKYRRPFKQRRWLTYVNEMQREVSLEKGCAYFDFYAAMGGAGSFSRFDERGYVSDDLVHPRGKGLDVLGELLADALLRGWVDDPADPALTPARAHFPAAQPQRARTGAEGGAVPPASTTTPDPAADQGAGGDPSLRR